jgi:thioredoxin
MPHRDPTEIKPGGGRGGLAGLALAGAAVLFAYGLWGVLRAPEEGADPGALPRLTDDTFATAIARTDRPVLVDFYADWCAPCRKIKPVLKELAAAEATRLEVYALNVDEAGRTAQAQKVSGIPCLVLYRGGQELTRTVGVQSLAGYQDWLRPHLGAASP